MTELLSGRDAYGNTLAELGMANKSIVVLDADLSGSTRTSIFAREFPDRFFNMGVSEQDMMGTAAGFAAGGKIPFVSTFAIFAAGRGWEQIRQSIAFPKANVKIVATHGGITVGADGASHQSIEDIGLMRILPHMTVIVPADAYETRAAIRKVMDHDGPVYIRLSREKSPVIYKKECNFIIGKANIHDIGNDITIIACGLTVAIALSAADILRKDGISVGVMNASTVKPIDRDTIIRASRISKALITVEEHTIIGGLGSAVAEIIAENNPVPIKRIGINDTFGQSGRPAELMEHYGLTEKAIIENTYNLLSVKKKLIAAHL